MSFSYLVYFSAVSVSDKVTPLAFGKLFFFGISKFIISNPLTFLSALFLTLKLFFFQNF